MPSQDWAREEPGARSPEQDSAVAAPLRVLLAEDTAISADMMQAMAERLSISMDVAANGLEALDMVREASEAGAPYSLLLVDIMMPILDGIETARRLRADGITPDAMPIIAITAATDIDEVRSYRKAGMQAFLEKPVALADLRSALHAWGHGTKGRARKIQPSALDALAEQFRKRKLNTLEALHDALSKVSLSEETIVELRRILHQLAGTAGSFGEPDLGDEARAFEIELMATFIENGDARDVVERAAAALGQRI